MAGRSNGSTAWLIFLFLVLLNGALYGSTVYLKHYNPAHWAFVTQDLERILLVSQYPDRLEPDSVAFSDATQVELIGASTFVEPRRAEVFVNTTSGRRVRVHYGSHEMYDYAEDLAKRLGTPLNVQDYSRSVVSAPETAPSAPVQPETHGQPPALPVAR